MRPTLADIIASRDAEMIPGIARPSWLPAPNVLSAKRWQASCFAILATAISVTIAKTVCNWLGDPSLIILTMPIMLCAYLGGMRAGLVATGLSFFGASFFLLPPIYSFHVASSVQRWNLAFVLLAGIFISGLCEALHRARARANRAVLEQQRIGTALRRSEATMAAAQRIAHLGSWELDLDELGDVDVNPLRWSDEMFRIAGYEPGAVEVNNDLFFQLVPPEEHAAIHAAVATALRGSGQYSLAHRLIQPDGNERVVHESAQIIFDDLSGRPWKMVGSAHDITDQRRAEEALRMQAHMLDNVGQAVISTDLAGLIIYANRFAEKLYGWTRAEMRGRSVMEVTVPKISFQQGEQIMAALRRGENWQGEFLVCDRAGREFPAFVTDTALHDAHGALIGIVGISEDITERKRAEEALRTSVKEFRDLAEAMPQIVWITRADGWNTYFNQQWMDYTGLTLEESLGHGWNKPFHPDDQRRAWEAWQKATAKAGVYSLEARLRRADGTYRWWLIRGVPLQDASGGIVKWFGTCTDIDDLKASELEVFRANRALKMLSDCNQTLNRAEAEPELLGKICRVAVETGGYRMAWVGFLQEERSGLIEPAAHAGVEEGYLSEVNVSLE